MQFHNNKIFSYRRQNAQQYVQSALQTYNHSMHVWKVYYMHSHTTSSKLVPIESLYAISCSMAVNIAIWAIFLPFPRLVFESIQFCSRPVHGYWTVLRTCFWTDTGPCTFPYVAYIIWHHQSILLHCTINSSITVY